MNVTALKMCGITIGIIGGIVAGIGGLLIARAACGDDGWGIAIGAAVAVVGGLLCSLGGFVTALKRESDD